MLDKSDPPAIPDGYCMSVAYSCLLDVVRSISLVVENIPLGSANDPHGSSPHSRDQQPAVNDEDDAFRIQLVNSSWCGLLAALTLLLEARYSK